ncbi:S1 RNA-binding domain-containing protein [Streptomyces griseoincarnatus]
MLDVVFLHGLDGDPLKTWTAGEDAFWPGWLAEDVPGAAVWSAGYDAWSSGWRGGAMPLEDRFINVLAALKVERIGERPLVFVTHSMGGLIVKEALLHAAYDHDSEFASFALMTKAVVFLGTPHNGSGLTQAVKALFGVYRSTAAVQDLHRNDAHLRRMSTRYQSWVLNSETGIQHLVFFETRRTSGVQVVDAGSADPALPRVQPVAVDADHITICKPSHRGDLVYGRTRNLVEDLVATITRGAEEVPRTHRSLTRLRERLGSGSTEEGDGHHRTLVDVDASLHEVLRDAIAAWLRRPETRTPLTQVLSYFADAGESGALITVQAKLVGHGDALRTVLGELWLVAQAAVDILPGGADDLRFDVRCRRWAEAAAKAVVDRWQPDQDGGAETESVARFKSRIQLRTAPSPRFEAVEMLSSQALRARDALGWIDSWTERLASVISEGRSPVDFADELFADLTTLRLRSPSDRLPGGIALLTNAFAAPAEVTQGDFLAGGQPIPSHVENGFFADRAWQVDPAVEHLELWLDSIESTGAEFGRKLPVYWFEGRSGCGKSVLMLQTLSRIRQMNRGMMLWLGNEVEELADAVSFALANVEPGDQTIIAIDDGFSPAAQAASGEHWRRAIRALHTARNEGRQLPVIVTCGPREQRTAFNSALLDDVEVTVRPVIEQLDADHAAELEQWFTARTRLTPPAHLASSNVLMVQRFFQYGTGASLESFARRFKSRLEGMDASSRIPAFIAKLLAVNRLYVGLPPASLRSLSDAERDVLDRLLLHDKHIAVSSDSGRAGVWLAHPHLADALFQGWFGEEDARKAAGFLRDAIIECGVVGENSTERTAPLAALKLAVDRSHTAAFQSRLDTRLLPEVITTAYEALARSAGGIDIDDLPAWIRLEQVLAGTVLNPTARTLGSAAISDQSLSAESWLPTAHALVDTLGSGVEGVEELLDAMRSRIAGDDPSSHRLGALAARLATFAGRSEDVRALAGWVQDVRHWTDSGWALAYRTLVSLSQDDKAVLIALAWMQSEETASNPGWSYVTDCVLARVDGRVRERVLEAAVAWLTRSDTVTNAAWGYVALLLLRETRGQLRERAERACLGWLGDERSRRMPTWHFLYRRMLDVLAPAARRERSQLIKLGRQWLQAPNAFSPGWPIVFDALHSTLDTLERDELLGAVTDWVLDPAHRAESNWINVCHSLMRHVDPDQHTALVALATLWVREPMHQFRHDWSKFLDRLIRTIDLTKRDDLLVLGMQWLREWIDQGDPRWGTVAQTLMRATDGTDQADLLSLMLQWIDSAAAHEDPLWPTVVMHALDRMPPPRQTPLLTSAALWLEASAHQPGPGWTPLFALLIEAEGDRDALCRAAARRLIGRGRFQAIDDWGELFALVLDSEWPHERRALIESGLEFLRTTSLDDRGDRSKIVAALLSVLDGRERADLVRLELLWLWNRHNWVSPSWNRVYQVMVAAAADQRGELRQVGLQCLRHAPGTSGWGWVLEQVHPLTTGQEREQLAAFLQDWFADPVNRDGVASSKALECAVAMADTAALSAVDIYQLGLDWLVSSRNFEGRRWSFVFQVLVGQYGVEHSAELVDVAMAWLSDSRSRADTGWAYVLIAAAEVADHAHRTALRQRAKEWLDDPVNWGTQTWGYVAALAHETTPGIAEPDLADAIRWLTLPLSRRNRSWRGCWNAVTPLLAPEVRATTIATCLRDNWVQSSRAWGFRYLDASGHIDLAAPAFGELLVHWCSRRRWSKDTVWPHVVAQGLKQADSTARAALTRLAEQWLLAPGSTSGRGAVEAALLEPVEFHQLAPQQIRSAIVSNIKDYGAFANLGGPHGLIHKTEMGNGAAHPRATLRVGQLVTVRILRVDSGGHKISLSLRLEGEPQRSTLPRLDRVSCRPGVALDGVVTGVVAYGVFVDVGGISGLAHISEIPGAVDPRTSYRVGQSVRCRIISFDSVKDRLSLSLKPPLFSDRDPIGPERSGSRNSITALRVGDVVEGTVTRAMDYGVLLDIGGVSGLLHNSQMDTFGSGSREHVARAGHRLRVRIHRLDRQKGRVEFSVRNLPPQSGNAPSQ